MDRPTKPYEEVKQMLGKSSTAWEKLLGKIRFHYVMDEDWREGEPTHKNYNNLFIRRSGKSLIIFSLREGYFIACIVLGKDEQAKFEQERESFGKVVRNAFDSEEALHDGKWLAFGIYDDKLVDDIMRLLRLKRKPNRKELPQDLDYYGFMDIGMSHADITNLIM
ncbi:MAG: DUF3788 domain-containing protein [Defluviitaleaceae bacterium]|nr:DUF3788 domain-containing protein [Defluviitaleaceae bacterium]